MSTPTQTHRVLERDSRRFDLVSSLAIACAIAAAVFFAFSLAGVWPPRALVDDSGRVR